MIICFAALAQAMVTLLSAAAVRRRDRQQAQDHDDLEEEWKRAKRRERFGPTFGGLSSQDDRDGQYSRDQANGIFSMFRPGREARPQLVLVEAPRCSDPLGPCFCACGPLKPAARREFDFSLASYGGARRPLIVLRKILAANARRKCRCVTCGPWIPSLTGHGFAGCMVGLSPDRWQEGHRLCLTCTQRNCQSSNVVVPAAPSRKPPSPPPPPPKKPKHGIWGDDSPRKAAIRARARASLSSFRPSISAIRTRAGVFLSSCKPVRTKPKHTRPKAAPSGVHHRRGIKRTQV